MEQAYFSSLFCFSSATGIAISIPSIKSCFHLLPEITRASGLLGSMSYINIGTQCAGHPTQYLEHVLFCLPLFCSFAFTQ